MYYQAITQCTRAVKNVEAWLDKAEEHAAAKRFDLGVLMTGRLAPDMKPFIYQVQSACDYLKAAAAWLSGQKPPKHEDTEQTIDEVRARIRKTVAFVESVAEAQYAGAAEPSLPRASGRRSAAVFPGSAFSWARCSALAAKGAERRMMRVPGAAAGAATLPRPITARGVAGVGAQASAASRTRSRSLVARS